MSTLFASDAKIKRKTLKAMATRIKNFLDSSDSSELSQFDLLERMKELQVLWDQHDEVQTRIETLEFTEPENKDEAALSKRHADERSSFEIPYFNLVTRFETILHNLEIRENQENVRPQNSIAPTRQLHTHSQLRLPKIELPSFSGNCEDWYAFYDTFEKLINSNSDLSEVQKFHYLRSSLKDDAAEVIKAFEITIENYKEAWELLIERYDNRRRIVQEHIKLLFNLQPMIKENHVQLRNLLDDVCKHLCALRALERPVEV